MSSESNLINNDLETLNEYRENIIQSLAKNMDIYGISDSIGRLYGTIYFSNHPLNLDNMRDALSMSKTSMSTGARTLLKTKMIKKVWKKGERKALYVAENDWYKVFTEYFTTRWIDALEANMSVIKDTEKLLIELENDNNTNPLVKEEIKLDLMKLEKIKNYYNWLENLIETFESGEIYDFVPKK